MSKKMKYVSWNTAHFAGTEEFLLNLALHELRKIYVIYALNWTCPLVI